MANWSLRPIALFSIIYMFVSSLLTISTLSYTTTAPLVKEDDDLISVNALIQCLNKHDHLSDYPISEVIYTRSNSSFQQLVDKRANNLRYQQPTTRKPLLIVAPKSELSVPAVVGCARANGVKIKIRSGGHDYEGISFTAPYPFMLLDMFNLNNVEVDVEEETAWVQSGATLGQIYYRIAEKSPVHAFPAGVCPTVGAGGHFSGGGYGALLRKYGLSIDNIVDARVVDANGRILDRKAMGEDFFWAICGGGGSSFGVILAWKLQLVRVPPKVTVFRVNKDVLTPGVNHILYKWQKVAPKLPKDLIVRIESNVAPTSEGNITISVDFLSLFLGDAQKLLKILDKSFPELGIKREDCKEMPWLESAMFWHRIPEGSPRETMLNYDIVYPAYRKIKGDFIKKPIPEAALPKLWEKIMQTGEVYMEWTPYGGMMDEIDEASLPFAHRKGNLFMIFYDLLWMEEGMNELYLNKARELYEFMGQFASDSPREGVLNYVDLDLGSWSWIKYFKGNFPKLVKVKTRVDPTDFFSHEQSIPTLSKLLKIKELRRGYNHLLHSFI